MQEDESIDIKKSWKERRKEQLRDEMLSAARELFDEQGFHETSVDDIVAKTGVAKGTFYLYFKTKADIAQIIIDESIADLETSISAAIAGASGDASAELRAVLEAQMRFFSKHRSMVSMLLTDNLTQHCASVSTNIYERIIRMGMLQRVYREVDAPVAAMMLRGMLAGAIQSFADPYENITDLCGVCMEFFEKGLRCF